ncbi:MAG TPA: permease-like cell division protein FtsX [Candidatus Saccharimonadales bacterium]|nr:permease-like cell division protein FtsX [Candidatus Saccharimonadales bacterium]
MKRKLITLKRIFRTGLVNFVRNISLAVAAMAVMVVTLTIVLFSVITNASFENTIAGITNKIDVSVYLQDNTSEAQAKDLVKALKAEPEVKRVVYLNKQQALESFAKAQGNDTLTAAANEAGNTVPATINVYVHDLNTVPDVKKFLTQDKYKKLQTKDSPSYNGDLKEAIDNITHATNVLRKIGIISIGVFAFICMLIIFNTIQMAIFNRRDEIQIMRLLGANTWYIRGPFVVESAVYGLLSAAISVIIINSAFLAASNALQASSLGLLDIGYANNYFADRFWWLLALQMAIGIIIGTVSSIIATRRYLKFRTK